MKTHFKMLFQYLCGVFMMMLPIATLASDIKEVLPLTDEILLVHFDDGYVTHHKLGDNRNSDLLHVSPLNLTDAVKTTSYLLGSSNDTNYSTAKNPSQVGRKSKGADFTMATAWDADWRSSWASEHWIYLHLPNKMQRGKTYTLTTASLAANSNNFNFTYDEKNLRSEAVHVNQVGYLPSAQKKFGYVYHWMGDKGGLPLTPYAGKTFWIVDNSTGNVEFTGQLAFRAAADNAETGQANDTPNKNFLGAEVYECDFSSFSTAGKYRLAIEGIGCSFPFEIGEDIYRASFKTTARGLYHNRSGIELTSEFTEFTRPAPHNPTTTPAFSGKLRYTTVRSCDTQSDGGDGNAIKQLVESGDKGTINTWGWYQDAGDWDGYPSHLRIPALLLLAYEIAPEKFVDNELNIPGKNNSIPDILDEARWLIEYLYRTRHAIMDAGYGTGGVSGRVCGDYWGGDMNSDDKTNGSWGDSRTWYVFGEDPMNTYMYAGLSAQYAYLLKLSGKTCPTSIDWQQEAVDAYVWAGNNTREGDDRAPHAVVSLKDAQTYAAVNLYKLTGKNEYHARFVKNTSTVGKTAVLGDDLRLSIYSYLLLNASRTLEDVVLRFKSATAATANYNVSDAAGKRGCRWGGVFNMPMLIGQATTPWVIDALMDYRINNDANSLTDAITTVDYFMGNNPLNQIWFTGEKSDIANPDRRYATGIFHMDSWYNTAKEAREVPGYSPYGPWKQERTLAPNTADGGANNGWWCNEWSYNSAYPVMQNSPTPVDNSATAWPGHERWFNQRYAPLACENTVHQNTVHWAISTGLLCSNITANPFDPDRLPDAEPFEELPDEEDTEASYLIVADFDDKPFYTDDDIATAPEGSFKVFTPGGTGSAVENPLKEGINTTSNVFEFTKNAGEWQVWGFEPKTQSDDFKNYTHLELMVYGNMSGIHVIIGNPAGGANWVDETIPVSAADAWQKISIPLPESGEFASVLFFPNSTVNESGAKSYYDNIRFRVAENYMLIADFDEKVLYDDDGIETAPDGSFKVYNSGTVEQPADNPDKTAPNTSEKVMKFIKGEGTWKLFGLETKGMSALDLSQYTRFEFKVKGNVSELYVQFPEFGQSSNLLVESWVNVSIDNEWTIVSLDLSGKSGKFSNINIFPNPTEEADATFYFDDFRLYESNTAPSGKETSMIFDFENITLGWGSGQQGFFAFNSNIVSIEENPDPVDPNTSSKVLYWKKDAEGSSDKAWGGYGFPLSKSYDLTKWTHFVFDVYAEKAVTKASVSFSMNNGDDNEISKGQKTDFSFDIPARQWTTVHLELDVSKLDLGGNPVPEDWLFNQFILFIGCDEIETFDVYTDNIRLEKIEYITPDTPLNLQYGNRQETSFDLLWDPVSNVEIEKYLVYRSLPGGSDVNVLYGESILSPMSVTGLEKGKDYYFAVKAVSVQGKESELSTKLLVPAFITVDGSDISSFAVYPNPVVSGGQIHIGGVGEGQIKVSLYTASGALVKREILSSPYFSVTTGAGNYFLQIESSAYKGTHKLVVYSN